MAQKIAPAALRLYTNKQFDASWFGDRLYGSLLHQTLHIKTFVQKIFDSIGTKTALSHIQATPHSLFVQSFFCTPRAMNKRMRKKHVRLEPCTQFFQAFGLQMIKKPTQKVESLFALSLTNQLKGGTQFQVYGMLKMILISHFMATQKQYILNYSTFDPSFHLLHHSQSAIAQRVVQNQVSKTKVTKYATHIENVIASYTQKRVVWAPYKVKHLFTSASFVAHYIALQFEQQKKKPFRTVFKDVLKQCVKVPHLVGVRISLAGRIGGAEMARVETARYGQTSLHVFSHRIDYHATSAYTQHGLLGIKVWISFKT
jgi:ribosomal protein S3